MKTCFNTLPWLVIVGCSSPEPTASSTSDNSALDDGVISDLDGGPPAFDIVLASDGLLPQAQDLRTSRDAGRDVVSDCSACSDDRPLRDDVRMPECAAPNPQGCFATGCPNGEICVQSADCVPSHCECSGLPGEENWVCSGDCGGGACVGAMDCVSDDDCPYGTTICTAGVCSECDDIRTCHIQCGVGEQFVIVNGCATCECAPFRGVWRRTCGDGRCAGHDSRLGVPACEANLEGESCDVAGERCDLENRCNEYLVCSDVGLQAAECD
jgi:hypothetical protein